MNRVAICIPSGDLVHADFAMSLAALTYQCGPIEVNGERFEPVPVALVNVKDSLVVSGRNKCVAEARLLDVTHVLFVDSDIVLHPHTLRRLLSHDRDIVGATYMQRAEPYALLGKGLDGKPLAETITNTRVTAGDVSEVSALPGGCMLVKMAVFDAFAVNDLPFQTPLMQRPDGSGPQIEGEDYFFCRRARELGFSIWLDWASSFQAVHLGQAANKIPVARTQEASNAVIH